MTQTVSFFHRVSQYLFLFFCFVSTGYASNTQQAALTLMQTNTSKLYPEGVRLSQALQDTHAQLDYNVYPLASGLINPNRQAEVDAAEHAIIAQLQALQRDDATHLANQLALLDFAFFEPINTDIDKVRVGDKQDPLLIADYSLYLPPRPNHIALIDTTQNKTTRLPFQPNQDIKGYLNHLPNGEFHPSVWVVQADRQVFHVNNIQWQHQRAFLTPGATLFISLPDLPAEHRDLNRHIAHLLALRLEP
ncbi:capsule biosynthesis GfcC family protein [Marinomonas sp. A79]|uniref:Capsule biosynthesis GfcC family protein n=1 Tax=Marinomonas vulgaris TaxID=2823372 RepID=A0ABS5HCB1_9GAMM|nr:capsule biosynthesis GfcC D2 domain-containing protein [Marinomonas vulgaris]MBR7889303.1 capsule biosynthesis GfcC family protein [Marinomonas vulgaris]